MSEMSSNIILVILVTSFATYLSRFLGVVSSEKIKETSKIFKWFNCIAYSVLAALIARMVVFPAGELAESSIFIRLFVVTLCVLMFLLTKKNLVYPTVLSAIILSLLNSYLWKNLLRIFLLLLLNYNAHILKKWIQY